MLKTIYCDKFKNKEINFYKGLNIVLGDNDASNSIGKSTMLHIIDYVLGGKSFMEKESDIVDNVGHHTICVAFEFHDNSYFFSRSTDSPNSISVCNALWQATKVITLDEYKDWLKNMYLGEDCQLSFREFVGLFSRIYGNENVNEKKPLNVVSSERFQQIYTWLLKAFCLYDSIETKEKAYKEKSEKTEAYKKASEAAILTLWNKTEKKQYNREIERIRQEIETLSQTIASHTVDLPTEQLYKVDELRKSLQHFQMIKRNTLNRITRLSSRKINAGRQGEETLSELQQFFPDLKIEDVKQVNKFHEQLTTILSEEIKAQLETEHHTLERIAKEEERLTNEIKEILAKNNPIQLAVSRLLDNKTKFDELSTKYYYTSQSEVLKEDTKVARKALTQLKEESFANIQQRINNCIEKLNNKVCENIVSPMLILRSNSYSFKTNNDSGTGTNYKGLILFDMAIMKLTHLPMMIHDSILFKNIEFNTRSNIINLYENSFKESQVFIALDAIKNYTAEARKTIAEKTVLSLSKGNELYGKSWNTKNQ